MTITKYGGRISVSFPSDILISHSDEQAMDIVSLELVWGIFFPSSYCCNSVDVPDIMLALTFVADVIDRV
jgi:hypothetical protein